MDHPKAGDFLQKGSCGSVYKMQVGWLPNYYVARKYFNNKDEAVDELTKMRYIQHSNIVRYVADKESNGFHDFVYYIDYEFANSWDLTVWIKNKKYCEDMVREWMRNLLSALVCLHERHNLSHLDIKPANLLIHYSNHVHQLILCDLGHAEVLGERDIRAPAGTYEYQPPEVYNGYKWGHNGDVWGAGAVLAELMMKKGLFDCNGGDELTDQEAIQELKKKITGKLPVIYCSTFQTQSDSLIKFCMSLLTADPKERPSSRRALSEFPPKHAVLTAEIKLANDRAISSEKQVKELIEGAKKTEANLTTQTARSAKADAKILMMEKTQKELESDNKCLRKIKEEKESLQRNLLSKSTQLRAAEQENREHHRKEREHKDALMEAKQVSTDKVKECTSLKEKLKYTEQELQKIKANLIAEINRTTKGKDAQTLTDEMQSSENATSELILAQNLYDQLKNEKDNLSEKLNEQSLRISELEEIEEESDIVYKYVLTEKQKIQDKFDIERVRADENQSESIRVQNLLVDLEKDKNSAKEYIGEMESQISGMKEDKKRYEQQMSTMSETLNLSNNGLRTLSQTQEETNKMLKSFNEERDNLLKLITDNNLEISMLRRNNSDFSNRLSSCSISSNMRGNFNQLSMSTNQAVISDNWSNISVVSPNQFLLQHPQTHLQQDLNEAVELACEYTSPSTFDSAFSPLNALSDEIDSTKSKESILTKNASHTYVDEALQQSCSYTARNNDPSHITISQSLSQSGFEFISHPMSFNFNSAQYSNEDVNEGPPAKMSKSLNGTNTGQIFGQCDEEIENETAAIQLQESAQGLQEEVIGTEQLQDIPAAIHLRHPLQWYRPVLNKIGEKHKDFNSEYDVGKAVHLTERILKDLRKKEMSKAEVKSIKLELNPLGSGNWKKFEMLVLTLLYTEDKTKCSTQFELYSCRTANSAAKKLNYIGCLVTMFAEDATIIID